MLDLASKWEQCICRYINPLGRLGHRLCFVFINVMLICSANKSYNRRVMTRSPVQIVRHLFSFLSHSPPTFFPPFSHELIRAWNEENAVSVNSL